MTSKGSAPVERPGKIICVGLNYRDHASEGGMAVPESPVLFAKWSTSLIGPNDPIMLPEVSSKVDYEGELAVLIGRRASHVSKEDALSVVAGYMCFNDVTARDLQMSEGQWTRSKSFDTFGPIGRMTPSDQVPDPQDLAIRTWLNDELVQNGTTADMVFGVADLIAHISAGITLEVGDIIATGTPAGVGMAQDPPRFLRSGDSVRIEIGDFEPLENPVKSSR